MTRWLAGLVLSALVAAPHARAWDLAGSGKTQAGYTITARGPIMPGDAGRLRQFLHDNGLEDSVSNGSPVLDMAGDGGDVAEATRVADVMRDGTVEARVANGSTCAGACAVAFLGGTRAYATGIGPGRTLAFGARLDFAGALSGPDGLAGLLRFGRHIGAVDPGALAEAAAFGGPVTRPRQIDGLHIELAGTPARIPDDWSVQACRRLVARHLPSLEEAADRVGTTGTVLRTVREIRQKVLAAWADPLVVARALAPLNDADAVDLATGHNTFLAVDKPVLDARLVTLERGAGFYFDDCVTWRTAQSVTVLLLDGVSHRVVSTSFSNASTALRDPGAPLW